MVLEHHGPHARRLRILDHLEAVDGTIGDIRRGMAVKIDHAIEGNRRGLSASGTGQTGREQASDEKAEGRGCHGHHIINFRPKVLLKNYWGWSGGGLDRDKSEAGGISSTMTAMAAPAAAPRP